MTTILLIFLSCYNQNKPLFRIFYSYLTNPIDCFSIGFKFNQFIRYNFIFSNKSYAYLRKDYTTEDGCMKI